MLKFITRGHRTLSVLMMAVGSVFSTPRSLAQSYAYSIESIPAGRVAQSSTGAAGTTVTTPALQGGDDALGMSGWAFTYWRVNGVRQADASGVALATARFTLNGPVTVTAVFVRMDDETDADDVPDWYEWQQFGDLTQNSQSDPDGDGFIVGTEYARGYSARLADTAIDGGVASRISAPIIFVAPGDYTYTINSEPANHVTGPNGAAPPGTMVTTPALQGDLSGSSFAYWRINGVRQADASGIALAEVTFTLNAPMTATAIYISTDDDMDGDGTPDWYEWQQFGDLTQTSQSDSDGDGLALSVEYARGYSARLADVMIDGGVASRMSAPITFLAPLEPADIVFQPANLSAVIGGTAMFNVATAGNPTPTYQWFKNGVALSGATDATLTIVHVQPADAAIYTVVVTNASGSATSSAARLTVSKASQTVSFSAPAQKTYGANSFGISATASSGLPVSFAVVSGPATVAGNTVGVTGAGTVILRAAQAGNANYDAAQSIDQSFTVAKAALTARADNKSRGFGASNPALTISYTGFVNGETKAVLTSEPAISTTATTTTTPGAYSITLSGGSAANYALTLQNGTLTVTTVDSTPTSRLVNISSRAYCSIGNKVTIGGFVITGSTPKQVLVRAVGPSLALQGIGPTELLIDPVIEVHRGASVIATNDNWGDNANAVVITTISAQIGAQALATGDSKSSALLLTLAPGVYSFVVNGKADTSGIVLLEIYDADLTSSDSAFVNIATRAFSTTGNGVTIGGFVISGNAPKRVLLRGVGRTLTKLGIDQAEVLVDPTIELHDGAPVIAMNDNFVDNANVAEIVMTGTQIGATPIDKDDTKSSVLLLTLQPGAYSFIARGKANTSGIVLVEVYDAD